MRPGSLLNTVIMLTLFTAVSLNMSHGMAGDWEKQTASDYSLPDPPDEAQTAIEIDVLLKLQNERTDAECKLGQKQRSPEFQALFSGFLSTSEIKILAPLMKRVGALGEKISQTFKNHYQRTRPYDVDSRLQPCVSLPGGHKSYPSSHATISTLDACVLSVIYTDKTKRAELRDLATQLSERRMKIGVHFPSDVEAGSNLGISICKNLASDSEFMTEVKALRRAL